MQKEKALIQVERYGHLTIITIDRPEVSNALDSTASHQLAKVFDNFTADAEQWVAILTGSGERAFCAGDDLKQRAKRGRQNLPASGFGGLTRRFDLDKPVIAAVNGAAVGGGFELALACDLIIAGDNARFGLPEVKNGLAALGGGIQRLTQSVGPRLAMELLLTGRIIDAMEALSSNIVNAVVPQEQLMKEARSWAEILLEAAPLALRASKQTLLRGLDERTLQDALSHQDEYPAVMTMRVSRDAEEGVQAFAEKRKPRWLGK